ncbi:hypothetical protein AB0J72_26925 [Dactylosporangium sp. NPDC049742]|uniref:hypothetical protein n=1 Tax=Dactylosporangium sp. NPDC049742 TaxID=3154737 RepID=UPI003428E904
MTTSPGATAGCMDPLSTTDEDQPSASGTRVTASRLNTKPSTPAATGWTSAGQSVRRGHRAVAEAGRACGAVMPSIVGTRAADLSPRVRRG